MSRIARVSKVAPVRYQGKGGAPIGYAEEDASDRFVHNHTSVAREGVHKPAGAAASVFDLGRDAGKEARAEKAVRRHSVPTDLPDPKSLEIEMGVPMPLAPQRMATQVWNEILNRMPPGGSVVLTQWHARGLCAAAKKRSVLLSRRNISTTHTRVWRLADDDPRANDPRRTGRKGAA